MNVDTVPTVPDEGADAIRLGHTGHAIGRHVHRGPGTQPVDQPQCIFVIVRFAQSIQPLMSTHRFVMSTPRGV